MARISYTLLQQGKTAGQIGEVVLAKCKTLPAAESTEARIPECLPQPSVRAHSLQCKTMAANSLNTIISYHHAGLSNVTICDKLQYCSGSVATGGRTETGGTRSAGTRSGGNTAAGALGSS